MVAHNSKNDLPLVIFGFGAFTNYNANVICEWSLCKDKLRILHNLKSLAGKPRSGKSALLKVPEGVSSGAAAPTSIESMSKVENRNTVAKCYFSAIEPKAMNVTIPADWEVVNNHDTRDSWSDAIEVITTVSDR